LQWRYQMTAIQVQQTETSSNVVELHSVTLISIYETRISNGTALKSAAVETTKIVDHGFSSEIYESIS